MNALTRTDAAPPNGNAGSIALIPQNLTEAMRLAEFMCRGKMVPQHLQGNPADMLMVIEQAARWGMSPFAVAQCTGVIKGKMSYEGKLVAAAVHTSGILSGRLNYEFLGTGDDRAVRVFGLLRGESSARDVVVTLKSARTDNEHWKKSPDQMLTYHAARVWARRHAPEVMLGVYAPEEFEAQQQPDAFSGTTIEAETRPQPSETARMLGDDLPDHSSGHDEPKRRTWSDLLHDIKARADNVQNEAGFTMFETSDPDIKAIRANGGPKVKEALGTILSAAFAKIAEPLPIDTALGMEAPPHAA